MVVHKHSVEGMPSQSLYTFIWHFLKGYKLFFVTFIFLAGITGLWAPFNNLLLKYIIDALSFTDQSDIEVLVFWPAVLFLINYEVHNLCWRLMECLNYKYQPIIKNQVISETFSYVNKQSHQFFQDNMSGSVSKQIGRLADNIEYIVHDISRHLMRGGVLLIASFISMYNVHPDFFYALSGWFFVFMGYSLLKSNRLIKLSEAHAAAETLVSGKIVDSLTNSSNVRIFARRIYEVSYLKAARNLAKKAFRNRELFAIKLHFIQGFSISIMLGVMLYFLIHLRIKGEVSIGDFALILGLSAEVGFMTWWTLEQVDALNEGVGKCKQSLVALFVPLEVKDKENATELIVTHGEIVFSNVKFHYKGANPLFQDKSVIINAGQKVGLVGYSGSGKSTFVNLILRLYDVTEGKILIDGQDISEVTQDSLRTKISMIPQDPSLFHRSIMDNIRYGKVEATDDEVIEAAIRAHAHEFINKLKQGYNSLVGERGIKLSGGQRQRISIARAILKNAPILILDEATSQLDSITENEIQQSLLELMNNSGQSKKTTIVIAHRLSTLLHMDRIMVFEQGKIVEDGSHAALLKQNGLYKMLWKAQVDGFLPNTRGALHG